MNAIGTANRRNDLGGMRAAVGAADRACRLPLCAAGARRCRGGAGDHHGCAMSADRHRWRDACDDRPHGARHDSGAPEPPRFAIAEGIGISGIDLRTDASCGCAARCNRWHCGAPAQGQPQTHPRDGRHGMSRQFELQNFPELRRQRAVALPGRRQRRRRKNAGPRHSRRRLSLSRERMRRRQRRVRRQPVGIRMGRMAGRPFPTVARLVRRRALDRRARQSRILQSRRAGVVALPGSAAGRAAAGLQRWPPTTISATTAMPTSFRSAAAPTPSSSCSIRRTSA